MYTILGHTDKVVYIYSEIVHIHKIFNIKKIAHFYKIMSMGNGAPIEYLTHNVMHSEHSPYN